MTQERERTESTPATARRERHELTDDDLTQVVGGSDGPSGPTDNTGKASPKLF